MFNPENGEQKNFQLRALTTIFALLYSLPEKKGRAKRNEINGNSIVRVDRREAS